MGVSEVGWWVGGGRTGGYGSVGSLELVSRLGSSSPWAGAFSPAAVLGSL